MKNVLVLGANGQIAKEAVKLFLEETNIKLTLILKQANRLKFLENNSQICIVEGDVLNFGDLEKAIQNQDIVFANLIGDLENHAKNILKAMKNTGLQRLIFINSMGIYDEVPDYKTYISRKSVAELIGKLVKNTNSQIRKNLGIHKKN